MKYKIIKPQDDVKHAVISKSGQTYEFTMEDIENADTANRKTLKELIGMRDFNQAKMDNVKQHHPDIFKVSEADMIAIHLYVEAKSMVKGYQKEIDKVQKVVNDNEQEVAEIKKQIPELASTKSPIQKSELNTNEHEHGKDC